MSARERHLRMRWGALLSALVAVACGGGGADDGGADALRDAAPFVEPDVVADAAPTSVPPDAGPDAALPDAAVVQPPCPDDTACTREAYCLDGVCTPGCRTSPDSCLNSPAGLPQRCDPATRQCAEGPRTETGCEDDADCAPGRFCNSDRTCEAGCREAPGDCGPFDRCDRATRRCVAPGCADDDGCPNGTYCEVSAGGHCVEGCRGGADCAAGFHCDETHQCRPVCGGDGDCAAGEYCDETLESCRVPCALPDHVGCLPDEACDPLTHHCAPGCRDDVAEAGGGNDTPETAARLNVAADAQRPGVLAGAAAGRILCPGDPDFFSVQLPAAARAEFVLTWDATPGDLTLDVSGADGRPLAGATGTSPLVVRTSALDAPAAGAAFVVGVRGDALAGPAAYSLSFRTADAATGCFPDARDPQDDAPAMARPAGQRPEANFVERFEGNLCRGDVDWTCFDLEANDGLRATLTAGADAASALRLDLFEASSAAEGGAAVLGGAALPEAPDALGLQVLPESALLPNGRYCLRVAAAVAGADAPAPRQIEDWALTLDFQRSAVRCGDAAEPNDTPGAAVHADAEGPLAGPDGRLPVGADLIWPEALRLCPGDTDVFRFEADAGDILRASIEGDESLGAAEIVFLDASGRPRGDVGGAQPPGAAAGGALAVSEGPSTWYVRVRADEVGGGAYRLHLRRDTPGLGCGADFQEPAARNDSAAESSLLAGPRADRYTVTNARLCSDHPGALDEDWYSFTVPAPGHRMCLDASFRQRDGNVDMELFQPDAAAAACDPVAGCPEGSACVEGHCVAPRASARTLHDGEAIAIAASEAQGGPYYLRLFSSSGETNAYDLAVTLVPPTPECGPDFQEADRPNDTQEHATPLGAGRVHVCDAWLCADERQTGDWYRITVPAGEDRTVHVGFDGLADGTVALMLVDPANPETGEVFVAEANTVAQCLNIRGGGEPMDLFVNLTAVRLADDGDRRLDYTLQVAPTRLALDPRGECDPLSGGLYREIPWPTYVSGL